MNEFRGFGVDNSYTVVEVDLNLGDEKLISKLLGRGYPFPPDTYG